MNLSLRMDADPAVIEHDIDQTRARVDQVLNELQARLSPEQLRARAKHFVQERSARLVRRVGRNVRDNPLPVVLGVLVAVGLVVLVHRRRGRLDRVARSLRHSL
ncbi:MAG TPA: DUF3618 domain-containing protein [Steroidobacteraceae bacterium]|nr:DUF3618 domain-containing protein [Steroidobacteraceae bacterium]